MNEIEENPPLMSDRLRRFYGIDYMKLAAWLFSAGLALGILLVSANRQDPSFNTASGQEVHNLLGVPGGRACHPFI